MNSPLSWDAIKKALIRANQLHPEFLKNALIVGGGAALLYNSTLENIGLKSFLPIEPRTGQTKFSHDIDFTHVYFEDYKNVFKDYLKKDGKVRVKSNEANDHPLHSPAAENLKVSEFHRYPDSLLGTSVAPTFGACPYNCLLVCTDCDENLLLSFAP